MKNNRRTFFKGAATLGAGALLPTPVMAAEKIKDEAIASNAKTVVDTASGKLRGLWHSGIFSFKGIPYGESTGGKNRFMPPVPVKSWTGIRNALSYGRACIQPASDSAHFSYDGQNRPGGEFGFLCHAGEGQLNPGEDCLQLNVWTPGLKDNRKRPVMVFYHGGGFSTGFDNALASYDGASLARHDVVVVTCNHRLNLFGYLNLPEVGGSKYTANAGLLDQVAVLQWVKDNITQFGGDPGNVTIFGQSGGGGKVLCMMAMPSAQGLFHKVINQSGPFLQFESRDTARAITEEMMRQLGLSPGDVDKFQDMPVDRLVGASAEMLKKMGEAGPVFRRHYGLAGWWPTVDGVVLPRHPFDPDAPSISAHVPLITGSVFNEQANALDREDGGQMTEAELQKAVGAEFGVNGPAIIAAYRKDWPKATAFEIHGAIAAEGFRRPALEQAARKAQLKAAPSYVYVYNWRTPMLDGRPGTFHASDLVFTFDNAVRCFQYGGLGPQTLAMSKRISSAYVAFARTGNPNHPGLPHWPAHTRNGATMVFDNVSTVRHGLEAEGLRLIAKS
jgi:para-nitrobenzyl esterase